LHTLEEDEAEIDKYAAQKVSVKGNVERRHLTVQSVVVRQNYSRP